MLINGINCMMFTANLNRYHWDFCDRMMFLQQMYCIYHTTQVNSTTSEIFILSQLFEYILLSLIGFPPFLDGVLFYSGNVIIAKAIAFKFNTHHTIPPVWKQSSNFHLICLLSDYTVVWHLFLVHISMLYIQSIYYDFTNEEQCTAHIVIPFWSLRKMDPFLWRNSRSTRLTIIRLTLH